MKNYFLIFGSLTMVALLVASSAPGAFNDPHGPFVGEASDPCSITTGASGVGHRVCLDSVTITEAEGPVSDVRATQTEGVTFVTFSVLTHEPYGAPMTGRLMEAVDDPRVVISRDGGEWSAHLSAATDLRLHHAADVAATSTGPSPEDPYRIIGLATPMVSQWRDALAEHDVTLHGYLPVNHVIARLGPDADEEAIAALGFVHSVTMFDPANKVEPGITDPADTLLIHVLTMPGFEGALDSVEQRALELGMEVTEREDPLNRLTLRIEADAIAELAAHPEVRWINPTSDEVENDMDNIREYTGAEAVQSAPLGFDGTGVVGQVMDSGLQEDHPDFQASLIEVDGPNSVSFHGTNVYGIVFGDGTGNPNAVGMAPGAQGTFAWYSSGMSRYTHAENLADRWDGVFQTHSWGRGIPKDNTYDSHSVEMDQIVDDLDVLGLQSMSNCGPECARREAMAKNIISVGALYHNDNTNMGDDYWWGGSRASTGPAADGRIKPELSGPYDRILTTTTGSGYNTGFGGTSGATPVNAGAVAIVNQMMNEDLFGAHPTGKGTPAAAKALLTASAYTYQPDQVDHVAGPDKWALEPYKRDVQGWGAPQLHRLVDAGEQVLLVDSEDALSTGGTTSYQYAVPEGTVELHVSLTWTDPPATPSAGTTLVNDLDLLTSGPAGLPLYWGNFGLNQAEYSLPGIPDRLNNLEKVVIPASVLTGLDTVNINVIGAAVQQDQDPNTSEIDQPYALAVVPIFE